MAENNFPPPPFIKPPVRPPDSPAVNIMLPAQQVPAAYANGWAVQIGESDITIIFGTGIQTPDGKPAISPVTAVTLTHNQFGKMEDELRRVSLVLQKMYDGPIPGIQGLTKAKLDAAVAEVTKDLKEE